MKIKVATHSGFCFGVKRAINIAEGVLKKSGQGKNNIYSLGPIIHNPQVVDELSQRGLRVVKDVGNIKEGTVIISSHGVPKDLVQKLKKKKIRLIDAVCPFVKYAQDIVRDFKKRSYKVIVVGDKEHPEVKALVSYAGRGVGLKSKKIAVISQTTQNKAHYIRAISALLKEDFDEVRIFNTICNDTSRRQAVTGKLLEECDVMVVVGGRNSANTKRLWHICKEARIASYHIETDLELKKDYFLGKKCVGVVSGASTPDSMVNRVVERIGELVDTRDEG